MTESLHATITRDLRERISRGDLPLGSHLPSEASLCREYSVSRGPVRQALGALRDEGLIDVTQGRAPIVRHRPLAHAIDTFFSFTQWIRAMGREPGQRTHEVARRQPTEAARAALNLASGQAAVDIVRLRLIDGEPAMLERSTFAPQVGQHVLTADLDAGSIFELLLNAGVPLDEGSHTIDAVAADALDAELLDVAPGAPLLRVQRITRSRDGVPLEYSDDRYRSDRAQLVIHNQRASRPAIVRSLTDDPSKENS